MRFGKTGINTTLFSSGNSQLTRHNEIFSQWWVAEVPESAELTVRYE